MDFGIYPPEINSGRMYTGPGSGPMLAASQAWNSLADELYTAAGGYQSAVAELTSRAWSGPSSASMSAAAGSYVAWLSASAAQAEETAAQARAAASAYETAFAMTVPPPVIVANRSLLAALVATNFLGQNTPAIAATEAQYAEMWAQDAVAMYGYAGSSATATALTPFSSPQQSTTPGGAAGQAAAAGQATSTSAGNAQNVASSVVQTLSAMPNALQSLATAAPAASLTSTPLNTISDLINIFLNTPTQLTLLGLIIPLSILGGPVDIPYAIGVNQVSIHADGIVSGWDGVQAWPGTWQVPPTTFPAMITDAGQTVSAGAGQANTVGRLSVPRGWTVEAAEVRPVALASPLTAGGPAVGPAVEAGTANTLNQMGIGGMAGQAMAGPPASATTEENCNAATRARLTPRVTGSASGGEPEAKPAPRTVVTGVAAAIREIARQRAEGRLSELEYTEQKKRLLDISSGHRPLA
ncbi:PPE family protein [Mycobacterium sp.]|uniref:PPE family protein n=1 Tax=Mycobacterium sp. TaxID=1785 RepID=UPI0031DE65F9